MIYLYSVIIVKKALKKQTKEKPMTYFMVFLIILAYANLWFLVIKCNRMIKKNNREGMTSVRDLVNKNGK